MSLYLLLDVGSIIIPLLFSFHPKIQFYKKWGDFLPALFITSIIYLIWDVIATKYGVWGFNKSYLIGINVFNLPLEEWLFFICIPYACVFTHYCLTKFYPNFELSKKLTRALSIVFILLLLIILAPNIQKGYTAVNIIISLPIILWSFLKFKRMLRKYYLTYLIITLPFLLVNGILTGSFIPEEVVWYNNEENLGIRLLTIPIEDFLYAFSLILLNLALTEFFSSISKKRANTA